MNKEYIIRALIGDISCTLVFPKEVASELGWEKDESLKCVVNGSDLIINKISKT